MCKQEKMCSRFDRMATAREQSAHRRFWGLTYGVAEEWGKLHGKDLRYRRKRITCPACGRRMIARVSVYHDGDDVSYLLPPHKIKGWWKKPGRRKMRDGGPKRGK